MFINKNYFYDRLDSIDERLYKVINEDTKEIKCIKESDLQKA